MTFYEKDLNLLFIKENNVYDEKDSNLMFIMKGYEFL